METLTTLAEQGAHAEATLTLPFEHRCRSRQRAVLDDGREVGLFLERGYILRDGDRLKAESGLVVAVSAAPEPVITALAPDRPTLARACYHLGNRHVPIQIGDGWVRLSPDHVLEILLRQLGLDPWPETAPFEPEAGAYQHGHHHHAVEAEN